MEAIVVFWFAGWGGLVPLKIFEAGSVRGQPSYYCGLTDDQHSGTFVATWGLGATAQLVGGQTITAPVVTIVDQITGLDVTSTMLVGLPTVGPNAAGTYGTVVTVAITGAVTGHYYTLTVDYTPNTPNPATENLPLVLIISCSY